LTAGGITGNSSKAVDGNTNGVFFTNPTSASSVSATQFETEPYLDIDLGATFSLEQINIFNRTDGADRSQNVYVLVSNANAFTNADLATSRSQAEAEFYISGQVGSPSSIDLNMDVRYIRVQMEGTGYLVLGEVEAIGCSPSNLINNPNSLIQNSQEVFFHVGKNETESEINWSCNFNNLTGLFVLEKSLDGTHFDFFGKKENDSAAPNFIFHKKMDEFPAAGDNYYRLKMIQKNGSEIFSQIKKVSFGPNSDEVIIFPNPAKDEMSINLKQYISKNVNVQIYDSRGVLMEEKYFENLEIAQPVFDLVKYENGLFVVAIKVEGFKMISKKFIVEKWR